MNIKGTNFVILLIFTGFFASAQQIQVTGKVTDSLQNPLGYANILAMPEAVMRDVYQPTVLTVGDQA